MTRHSRQGRHQWRTLSRVQKVLVVVSAALELVVTSLAAKDLAARDSAQVRGPKAVWIPLLAVQPVGPIAYLLVGRRR